MLVPSLPRGRATDRRRVLPDDVSSISGRRDPASRHDPDGGRARLAPSGCPGRPRRPIGRSTADGTRPAGRHADRRRDAELRRPVRRGRGHRGRRGRGVRSARRPGGGDLLHDHALARRERPRIADHAAAHRAGPHVGLRAPGGGRVAGPRGARRDGHARGGRGRARLARGAAVALRRGDLVRRAGGVGRGVHDRLRRQPHRCGRDDAHRADRPARRSARSTARRCRRSSAWCSGPRRQPCWSRWS